MKMVPVKLGNRTIHVHPDTAKRLAKDPDLLLKAFQFAEDSARILGEKNGEEEAA